jgi:1-acyl-sn-glycerol-3-phosphate acyltransferase
MQGNSVSYMGSWSYAPAPDLGRPLGWRLRRFPREPDVLVYALRSVCAVVMRTWVRLYHRFEIEGRENLPPGESFVMIANHCSHLDTLCLLSALPLKRLHRAFPAAAQDYFFLRTPRMALAAITVNAMPFDRQHRIRRSLELCRELLSEPGNILILFPEGTRSNTGELGEFKSGIGMLVAGTSVPVVPCHLRGAFQAWPKGKRLPRPTPVRLTIGSPRCFKSFGTDRDSVRQITGELRESVVKLNTEGGRE